MYVFYGEENLLEKVKNDAEVRNKEVRCFTPTEGGSERLLRFIKKNCVDIEVIGHLGIDGKELASVKKEVEEVCPEILQVALVRDDVELQNINLDNVLRIEDKLSISLFKKIDDTLLKKKSKSLRKAISSTRGKIAIFIHDNPDPDAIASAMAFEDICASEGVESRTYFGGSVGHPENEVLLEHTDFIIEKVKRGDVKKVVEDSHKIAFIDFAESGVNNILPEDVSPDIVLDHHFTNKDVSSGEYNEIRSDVGATSTLMVKHLQNLEISIDPLLASALLVGIRVDTHDYTKNISTADYKAISYLSAIADKDILDVMKAPSIYPETLDAMGRALSNREVKDTVLTAFSGEISHRDDLSLIADFMLRERDILTVLIYGIRDDKIHMSARSKDLQTNVGKVMENAYLEMGEGGGHRHAAGGCVSLDEFADENEAVEKIAERFTQEVFGR
ncbi:MAG: DHHA1 domain-containing protein [Candidatus Thermoplasmatota archaeon]